MSSAAQARPQVFRAPPSTSRPSVGERRAEALTYLGAAVAGIVASVWVLRLWRADLRVPFFYLGNDATAVAAHFKTVLETGWYEYQPMLGAPAGQQYHDFPQADNLHYLAARVLGWFTDDFAVAMNVYYLLGFPLAALSATYFLRVVGVSRPFTVALATLYAVAPYHTLRNEGHLWLASYYPVPLALVVVWRVIRGKPIWGARRIDPDRLQRLPPGWRVSVARAAGVVSGRGMWTTSCLALVASASSYYAVFTLILLAGAGIVALLRRGDRRRFGGAVIAGATILAVVVLNMLPDMLFRWVNGPNSMALSRDGAAAEVYALKISSLLLPAPGHPIGLLSDSRFRYDETYPLPSESPVFGLAGAVGLLILLGTMVVLLAVPFARRAQTAASSRREQLRDLATLTLIGLLFATVGGLATLISFVTPNIRGWNRISILLLLFCLAAVGVVLDGWLARRASRHPLRRGATLPRVLAGVVLVLGVADQSLTLAVPPYADSAAAFASDQQFVRGVEAQVPAGSMIFQYPYVEFPESPSVNGVADSDQLRMYLHSPTLLWSSGGIRGRPTSDWPAVVTSRDTETMVRSLATIGFAGLVTDRKRLGDTAEQAEAELARVTGPAQLVSPDGRWAYFSLSGPAEQLRQGSSATELTDAAARLTNPVMPYPAGGDTNTIDRKGPASTYRVWTTLQPTAAIPVVNDRSGAATVQLDMQLGSRTGAPDVTVTVGDWSAVIVLPDPPAEVADRIAIRDGVDDPSMLTVSQNVTVPAGTSELVLSPGPATQALQATSAEPVDMRYTFTELYFLDPELVN